MKYVSSKTRRKIRRLLGEETLGGRKLTEVYTEEVFDKIAERFGYEIYRSGWPDRVLEKDGKIIFVEIKSMNDELTPKQKRAHKLLRKVGIKVETVYADEFVKFFMRLEPVRSHQLVYDRKPIIRWRLSPLIAFRAFLAYFKKLM